MKVNSKLTYALSAEGKLVHVDDVPNGKACGCFCPNCGEGLQAKQGTKRKHHFSHLSGTECEAAYESMLHLLAKEKVQESFYKNEQFYIEFDYTSFCAKTDCIFIRGNQTCGETTRRSFDIKQWYDSCEQEKAYDNITRRSDLKFFSKLHPEIKPIYVEFCVTHASDADKLHSGNRIIETLIEREEDVFALASDGFIEKSITIGPDWDEKLKHITTFYGFKVQDRNNVNISRDVWVIRCSYFESGKMFSSEEKENCRSIKRKNTYALCELIFSEGQFRYDAFETAMSICYDKYHIKNCNVCKNNVLVQPWFEPSYMLCKMYKHLQIPKSLFDTGGFCTTTATSCSCFWKRNTEIDKNIKYITL